LTVVAVTAEVPLTILLGLFSARILETTAAAPVNPFEFVSPLMTVEEEEAMSCVE
jgi:hypothetical protein